MIVRVSRRDKDFSEVFDLEKEVKHLADEKLEFFLGRAQTCYVYLNDRKVSREAGKFIYVDGSWKIESLQTSTKIILNGQEVLTVSELSSEDRIEIGPFILDIDIPTVDMGFSEESVNDSYPKPVESAADLPTDGETKSFAGLSLGDDEATEFRSMQDEAEESGPESSEEVESEENESESPEEENFDLQAESMDDGFGGLDSDTAQEFSDGEEFENQFDDGFENSDDDENDFAMTTEDEKTSLFSDFATIDLKLFGEFAPYDSYRVVHLETFIGRDPEKCQIVLNDSEVSAVHAVIKKDGAQYTLEDLNSSNGTLLNGERINSKTLVDEDEFLIGGTSFTVIVGSDFLRQEEDRLMPVETDQELEVEHEGAIAQSSGLESFEGDEDQDYANQSLETSSGSQSLFSKDALKDPEKRKKLLYILVGFLALWVLLDEEEAPNKVAKSKDSKELLLNKEKKQESMAKASSETSKLSKDQIEEIDALYNLVQTNLESLAFDEALQNISRIEALAPSYKNLQTLKSFAHEKLAELEEIERKKREELEKKEKEEKVKALLTDAEKALEEKQVIAAEELFNEIARLDPNNFDLSRLKRELEAYKREVERKKIEETQKRAERRRQESELEPGENYYASQEWYKAILKLDEFLKTEGIDEDLREKASKMLSESRENLNKIVKPLSSKAQSLKSGQDLKGAYENYLEILKYDPSFKEALVETEKIREELEDRSKKVYREAIIAESLSLFNIAKDKFQEVKQISPSDSEYYVKAENKLKEYVE